MSNAADLAEAIHNALIELERINGLILAGNTDYNDIFTELEILIEKKITLYFKLATDEINGVIGGDLSENFDYFISTGITFARLQEIYSAVMPWATNQEQLAGLVALRIGDKFPELEQAIKQRIILEVQVIFNTYNEVLDGTIFTYDTNNVTNYTALQLYNNGIPFPYDRQGTASYAVQVSRANFQAAFPFGNALIDSNCTIVASSTPPSGIGSILRYSTLRHVGATANCEQSTGSAYFVSEALFAGGKLPMRICSEVNCDSNNLDTPLNWLARCGGGPNLEATQTWRIHQGIKQYFMTVHQAVDNLEIIEIGNPPNSSFVGSGLNRYMRFSPASGSTPGGGQWRDAQAQAEGQDFLYQKFSETNLAILETGDYVFLDLGPQTSAHGLLIIGWGTAIECPDGLNAQPNIHFAYTRPRNIDGIPQDSIPYVVDFAYGFTITDLQSGVGTLGWLQDVRPRPFYATNAEINLSQLEVRTTLLSNSDYILNSSNFTTNYLARLRNGYLPFTGDFGLPSWSFFHIPDSPNQRIHIKLENLASLEFPCI